MQTLDAALLCTTVISYPACFGYSNPEGMLVVSNSLSGELDCVHSDVTHTT